MNNIPVSFTTHSKQYTGYFSRVSGAGSSGVYHLTVDGKYFGQLNWVPGHPGFEGGIHSHPAGWRFTSNNHDFGELAEYFGEVVTEWEKDHS